MIADGTSRRIAAADREQTAGLARELAAALAPGDLVLLSGELGTGKTAFVRWLVAALGGDPELVTSPTYTLVHRYAARIPVWHVDAYRLGPDASLSELGVEELAEEGVICLEWPEHLAAVPETAARWRVRLTLATGGRRDLDIAAPSGRLQS